MMNINFKETLGNLFSPSPFQDIVDQATSEYLLTPDWEKNIHIIDQVNLKIENAKEVMRAIRRRTSNSNPKVQFLALTLLEMGVKNCGHVFRAELCQHAELLGDVLKIATRETRRSGEHESTEKALEMINTWNHCFRQRSAYPQLTALYHQALGKGATFEGLKVDDDALMDDGQPMNVTGIGNHMAPTGMGNITGSGGMGGMGGLGGMGGQGVTGGHGPDISGMGSDGRAAPPGSQPQTFLGRLGFGSTPKPAAQPQRQQRRPPGPQVPHGAAGELPPEMLTRETDPAVQAAIHAAILEQNAQAQPPVPERDPAEVLQQLIDEAHSVVGLFTEILTANANSPEVLATDDMCQQVRAVAFPRRHRGGHGSNKCGSVARTKGSLSAPARGFHGWPRHRHQATA